MITPGTLRGELETVALAGFNVILLPVYVNGFTAYPSQAARRGRLDEIDPMYRGRDPVYEALDTAGRLGLTVWGLARPYSLAPRYGPTPQRLLKKHPDWRMRVHPTYRRTSFRHREAHMACPINPEHRRRIGDILTELVAGYSINGLVVNYTGFGLRTGPLETSPFCFCDSCAERYAAQTGGEIFSDALDPHGLARLRNWQTRAAHASLEYLRHRIIKTRRTIRLISRVAPQWRWSPEDSAVNLKPPFVMDWNSLLNTGAVEELLVDHEEEDGSQVFSARLASDLAYLHDDSLVLPSLYLRAVEDLREPVAAVRRYPVAGLLVECSRPLTRDEALRIRDTHFAEPARSPDDEPLMSVAFLLRRVQARHRDNDLINDFMRDFLRLIEMQVSRGMSFAALQLILENLAGLQTAIRRGRLGAYPIPESVHRDIGLARRIIRLACLDVRA